MNAIDRTHIDTSAVLGADAGLADDIGHCLSLLLNRCLASNCPSGDRHGRQVAKPHGNAAREIHRRRRLIVRKRSVVHCVNRQPDSRDLAAGVIAHGSTGAHQPLHRLRHGRAESNGNPVRVGHINGCSVEAAETAPLTRPRSRSAPASRVRTSYACRPRPGRQSRGT